MSSPEAMTHAIRQQDFDMVAVKLARQGRPAMRPSERIERTVVCTYLAPNGDRCAAGHLFDLPGDSSLQVIDGPMSRNVDLHDGLARKNGLVLADIDGGPKVHGVSG